MAAIPLLCFLLLSALPPAHSSPPQLAPHTRRFFYAGGEYATDTNSSSSPPATSTFKSGQVYVEHLVPLARHPRKLPLVFIPGAGQTATNFLATPDGRPGWADHFLRAGREVYLTDPPQRGRSPWVPSLPVDVSGTVAGPISAETVEQLFTATSHNGGLWPQAHLHTQWPGPGTRGDPVFDAFYSGQVQLQADRALNERLNAAAYTALLDEIARPVVLVTHSQAGAYGWRAADARSRLVRGVVALEPPGPPFENAWPFEGRERTWGVTDLEIEYDPPAGTRGELLETVVHAPPPGARGLLSCELQDERGGKRARQLANLRAAAVLVVTAEASFHAPYDWCTAAYLRQAGVRVDELDLARAGVRGNGHMMMVESNSEEIAGLIGEWVARLEGGGGESGGGEGGDKEGNGEKRELR